MDDEELQQIYTWVDEIPLSKPKRNIARDFSDGGELSILSPLLLREQGRANRWLDCTQCSWPRSWRTSSRSSLTYTITVLVTRCS